jgi:Tetrapyrrole (Corrin/Porphyrin) Methylases
MRRIRVVGLGVRGIEQLTLAGLRQLREAEAVLHLVDPSVDVRELTDRPTGSLHAVHREGLLAGDDFGRLLARILECAGRHRDIAVLLPGDPRVGVTVVQRLQRLADDGEFALHVEPGISRLTAIVNDLGIDPLERGTLVVDANRLLLFEQIPDPAFNTFIHHVCPTGATAHPFEPADQVALLQQRLLRVYEPDHPVRLIEPDAADGGRTVASAGRVGALTDLLGQLTFASTLFVPAAAPRRVDRAVLALLAPELAAR